MRSDRCISVIRYRRVALKDNDYGGMPYKHNPEHIVGDLKPLQYAKRIFKRFKDHDKRLAAVDIEVPKHYRSDVKAFLETARTNELSIVRKLVNEIFKN